MGRMGEGAPVLVWKGYVIELPHPKKGGRKERYVRLNKIYENIHHELMAGDNLWRFEGEYEFGKVDAGIIDTLLDIYNHTSVIKWIPYGDLPAVAFWCIIDDVNPDSLDGIIKLDTMFLKLRSKYPVSKIPTMNMLYGCFMYNRIGIYGGEYGTV